MSAPTTAGFTGLAGKKAVHVKWAGKTIALGTFPSAEADEKCTKAKALTRAWRSTMRPKPSRDWVISELERLGVRVVSGRLGRRTDEGDGEQTGAYAVRGPVVERNNSIGMYSSSDMDLNGIMSQRRASLGLSLMGDDLSRRGSLGSLGPLGSLVGMDAAEGLMPSDAYNAAADFARKSEDQQRRASSIGLGMPGDGAFGAGSGVAQMGMSVNANQHYEMLKLHHMNLLNEIQETTLMMNLYQQQQLQQQQQQQQQQHHQHLQQQQALADQQANGIMSAEAQLGIAQQQAQNRVAGLDSLHGGEMAAQRAYIGQQASGTDLVPQQPVMPRPGANLDNTGVENGGDVNNISPGQPKGQENQVSMEDRLQKLQTDVSTDQKGSEELQNSSPQENPPSEVPNGTITPNGLGNGNVSGQKRQLEEDGQENLNKRAKPESQPTPVA